MWALFSIAYLALSLAGAVDLKEVADSGRFGVAANFHLDTKLADHSRLVWKNGPVFAPTPEIERCFSLVFHV